jgi:tetratricopeptide (TPR) repeat protein
MVFLLIVATMTPQALQAQTQQEVLNQYIADLQKNTEDTVLREKIIMHVQTMNPAPTIPEEARKSLNRGMAAAEGAMNADDYKDAIEEFQKAVDIAPWLGIGYRNLAVMQDKAGHYPPAVRNLKLFLLTNPSAADADAAKTLMDKIEYRQEKAARESSPEALAAKKQKEYAEWLKKIDGRRYTYSGPYSGQGVTGVLDVRGMVLVVGSVTEPGSPVKGPRGYAEHFRYDIKDRVAKGRVDHITDDPQIKSFQDIYIISEDGERITMQVLTNNVNTREMVYLWQR